MAEARNIQVLASAARTAAIDSSTYPSDDCQYMHCVISVTAITDTPSLTPTIEGWDEINNVYYDVLVGTAITATGTTVLKIGPGLSASSGASACDAVPQVVAGIYGSGRYRFSNIQRRCKLDALS